MWRIIPVNSISSPSIQTCLVQSELGILRPWYSATAEISESLTFPTGSTDFQTKRKRLWCIFCFWSSVSGWFSYFIHFYLEMLMNISTVSWFFFWRLRAKYISLFNDKLLTTVGYFNSFFCFGLNKTLRCFCIRI